MWALLKAAGARLRHQPYALIVVFCMLAACIITAGYVYYHHSVSTLTREVERHLAAVAELRADAIEQFRSERLADARLFQDNASFGLAAARLLAEADDLDCRAAVMNWVSRVSDSGEYDSIALLDAGCDECLSLLGSVEEQSPALAAEAGEAAGSGEVRFVDFYRDEGDQQPRLAVLAPLALPTGSRSPSATLVLGIDPRSFLYPLVADVPGGDWPLDTVLVRRDSDRVLYLSDPRNRSGAALVFHAELVGSDLAVARVFGDPERVVRGEDLSGTSVVAFGSPVADSPWYVVSSVPEAEAFAPLRQLWWLIVILVTSLLVGVAAALYGTVLDTVELRRKDEELRSKNAEMEHFTYAVSHDLKSPLWTVKTYLGFVEQDLAAGVETSKIEKSLAYMRGAAERMTRLLDELLRMSRVGRQEHAPTHIPVREVIDEALSAVAGRIAERNVVVTNRSEEVILYGNRSRLVEVWQNLVDNAVKYMGEQSLPQIDLGTERKGRTLLFYVRDNGMGIEPRYHRKVFDLFERLDDCEDSDSTGLGLALVKKIVTLYGGTIWVESPGKGGGSVFKFSLPRAVSG